MQLTSCQHRKNGPEVRVVRFGSTVGIKRAEHKESALPESADISQGLDRGQERKPPVGAADAAATGLERFDQASPVGTIAAVSTIKITLLSGARVQCKIPFGTVKP